MSSECEQSVKLRHVIQALQREDYARKFKIPPDNLGDRNLALPCLNPECTLRASVNFAATNDYRAGLYNCNECGLRGDAIDLIIALAGDALDPYEELNDKEAVAQAHAWAERYAGAKRDKAEDAPMYVPSWLPD
jgi:hypothetical protein